MLRSDAAATIFIDTLPWDIRSRNTDWRHARFAIPQLTNFEPELQFTPQSSPWITLAGNAKTFRAAIGRRIGMRPTAYALATNHLSVRDLRKSKADLIVTHTSFPLNAGDTPVHWFHSIVDPQMQRSYGVSESAIAEEISTKLPLFRRAARVQCYTAVEAQRHAADYPDIADRFVTAPLFMPHATACPLEQLDKHRAAGPVRILFVGNNAARKALPELLEAFVALPPAVQGRAELTVISNFDRSHITLPQHDRITVLKGAPSATVMEHMRQAHILVNVAHFESYGLVFIEAMSQGVVCMAPDWEVQRELLDEGRAGLNLAADATSVRLALERLIEEPETRYRLALAGWQRFLQRYAPAVVARQYRDMFLEEIAQHRF